MEGRNPGRVSMKDRGRLGKEDRDQEEYRQRSNHREPWRRERRKSPGRHEEVNSPRGRKTDNQLGRVV